ncbi:hypothetical protein [Mycobacterium sp. Aquia_213]|uniref:hypothetical protein n=1 Tax=Mycobacterium sp. Aquia_213 TaxID=2991728 RepID=UPI0022722CE6|nr:hypothetical protein [Mycobacterium sp. Aquia_213]WAC92612.1 hypothetical protein LMQ14_05415 [Mycobacterium sp. Aquia_213]
MATIVLVHGIAQEQKGAKVQESMWLPALADGVAKHGNQELADLLWRNGTSNIDVRMAYYGTPFIDPGAMGDDDVNLDTEPLPNDVEELTEQLAMAWLEAAVSIADDPDDRLQAEDELDIINGNVGEEAQGLPPGLSRPALNALARVRWFAPFGMAVASRFVWKALTQVTRYLTDDQIRTYAQDQVLHWIGPDTRLVIGHSLGSVVAYEAVHRAYETALPRDHQLTLMTLGSPLGLRSIVYDRLRPQPPGVPPAANRWENLAAADDLVAAVLDLTDQFLPADNSTIKPCNHIVDNGSQPHDVTHYLTKPTVGRIVTETLTGT